MQKSLHLFANIGGVKTFLQEASVTFTDSLQDKAANSLGIGVFSFFKDGYRVTPSFFERLLLQRAMLGQLDPLETEAVFVASSDLHGSDVSEGLNTDKLPALSRWLLKGVHPTIFEALRAEKIIFPKKDTADEKLSKKWSDLAAILAPFQYIKSAKEFLELVFAKTLVQAEALNPQSIVIFFDSAIIVSAFQALGRWLIWQDPSLSSAECFDQLSIHEVEHTNPIASSLNSEAFFLRLFMEWLADSPQALSGDRLPRLAVVCRSPSILDAAVLQFSSRRNFSALFHEVRVRL